MASVSISCPSCSATDGVVRNGKSTATPRRSVISQRRQTGHQNQLSNLSKHCTPAKT
ncbi:IS1 family transposase, partial [Shigella sonnei]|uniref:IS1 family transposase n=1 Tax=Shigella sonnei TaxID=624 RepID=UPI00338FD29D